MTKTTDERSGAWRSRWAAVGAAAAIVLGAGGIAMVNAEPSAPASFNGDTPARILDTRSDVGLPGPFVTNVSQKLQVTGSIPTQPATGDPVNATVVPTTATSVVLNVTVVQPQTIGFLAIRPGDATGRPATSNLNFSPGVNLANSVTVQLSPTGTIDIYIEGTVREVLIDVVGFYTPAGTSPDPTDPTGVTIQAFEVFLNFDGSETIAENGDLSLSLRCREDDTSPDTGFTSTDRNNMQFRAFSRGEYLTTLSNDSDFYENEGVTIARALGSSVDGTKVQTTFVTRNLQSAATMTAADGRQISVDGDSVQVMFNLDNSAVNANAFDCYARGTVTLVPARSSS